MYMDKKIVEIHWNAFRSVSLSRHCEERSDVAISPLAKLSLVWGMVDSICISHFLSGNEKYLCCRRPAGGKQLSTGQLHLIFRVSPPSSKRGNGKKPFPLFGYAGNYGYNSQQQFGECTPPVNFVLQHKFLYRK